MVKRFIKEIIYRLRGEYTTEKLIKMGLSVGVNFKRLNGVILDPSHCWLITIGNNVTMAPRVHILAHDASTCAFLGYAKIGRVEIGNNVFIGADSIVLPNVKVGNNVIVGANSTVTKDLKENSVYAGNPARYICSLEEYLDKHRNMMTKNPCYDETWTLRKKISLENKNKMKEELNKGIGYVE